MSEATEKRAEKSPEVSEKATRRRFTAAYKAQILAECDACQSGELGAVLRREGLYSSMLTRWRSERDAGTLAPKQRGRKATANKQDALELARLKRENERLAERLRQAEIIIDVQKKVSEMLGIKPRENQD
jgi:transposase-like protein